ncbi:MAG TPA: UDP-N-acetylmuramoyl-tripeptide--D-alanyl-D-alanine ligase, partial [Gammaproteobacteria bacterium]|nr:UDP-N-acetylmuramoyl-tripeptide--D-alanyl-D-alanine ligase [Gammaproteobacteria bacterium]
MSLRLPLSEIARAVNGRHLGAEASVSGVGIDTRRLHEGELFVALPGEHHDGHGFVGQARDKGAAAAMVSEPVQTDLPLVQVHDSRRGLAQLAGYWRGRFSIPVIAVTGSNGKTTVKEMTAAILRRRGQVLATEGNKNNDIGMPLTLLRLSPEHQYGVIEMGANHAGEIAGLCAVARPTVAVVTNAGPAHLEGFGSLEGVARAKGELFAGLEPSGIAVINADDAYYPLWRALADGRKCLSFGIERDAEVSAGQVRHSAEGTTFELRAGADSRTVTLRLAGLHNVRNALAAAAVSLAAGATLADIAGGLASVTPVYGRLCIKPGMNGARLIDDSYNANPSSLQAALEALADMPGEKVVVLGDMYELG